MSILKAHWECWSECNLGCSFCYRMKEPPMSTQMAMKCLEALSEFGIKQIVFAGGDPSLRADIGELIGYAKRVKLKVEVQTNAHLFRRTLLPFIANVDLFGFSLDSVDPILHDGLRAGRGNHRRVVAAIEACDSMSQPFMVRTLIASCNVTSAVEVGTLLEGRPNLRRWSLLEFSSVGEGFLNKWSFVLSPGAFDQAVADARRKFPSLPIDSYAERNKGGVYFLIKPNGDVYTTRAYFEGERYEAVGNLLKDGVEVCYTRLGLDERAHRARYEKLI